MMLLAQSTFSWDHGIAIAVLVPVFSLLTYATHRVFDKKDGLAERGLQKMEDFFNSLLARIDKQQSMCNAHGEGIYALQETFPDGEEFKTVDTNHSLADMARVELIKLRSVKDIQPKDKEKIIKILSAVIERLDPNHSDSNCPPAEGDKK